MIEFLAIPVAIGIAALVPKRKTDDRKNIELIFKRLGIGFMDKDKPVYPKRGKNFPIILNGKQIGITYTYKMPIGLPSNKLAKAQGESGIFEDALNKPVDIEFKNGFMQVHVYDEKMPREVPYEEMELKKGTWEIPLGRTHHRIIYHDFDLNPHANIGGTTGFGKTVILKTMITALIESNPDDTSIFIVDMKGGLEFARYECLKQIKYVAGNAEESLKMLEYLEQVLMARFQLFRAKMWNNIVDTPIKERIFVIVDEGAQLIPESRNDKVKLKCQEILEKIAALGRGVGLRLIFATQYPTSDALPRQIKQNSEVRICFRLPDKYASAVVLGEGNGHAADLPTDIKGRCYYKTHEILEMQTPLIKDSEMWNRLAKYQEPILLEGVPENVVECEEATTKRRKDIVTFV